MKWKALGTVTFRNSKKKNLAESGFDPPSSGLWARRASAAPLSFVIDWWRVENLCDWYSIYFASGTTVDIVWW
jgi:hypothetical protein